MSERDNVAPSFSRCYRCAAGCIHLTCGNVTLTLTSTEFLVLAEAIGAMRHAIREEVQSARKSREVATSSLTM